MTDRGFGVIELLLVFGLVIGWAGWQWWSVRRELKKGRRPAESDMDGA